MEVYQFFFLICIEVSFKFSSIFKNKYQHFFIKQVFTLNNCFYILHQQVSNQFWVLCIIISHVHCLYPKQKLFSLRQPGNMPFERKYCYLKHYEQLHLVLKSSLYTLPTRFTERIMFAPCLQVKTRFISFGGVGDKERDQAQQVPSLSNTFLIKISNPISPLEQFTKYFNLPNYKLDKLFW